MNRIKILYFAIFLLSFFGCSNKKPQNKQYNVIFILADDIGYSDLGCYGQTLISTPNIDKLAKQGLLYTQHYSGSNESASSLTSLISGLHNHHTTMDGNKTAEIGSQSEDIKKTINLNSYSIAKIFKEAGYTTGVFGNWILDNPENNPKSFGFDDFFGFENQSMSNFYYPPYLYQNDKKLILHESINYKNAECISDIIHKKTLAFITKNKKNLFFTFLPYSLTYNDIIASKDGIFQNYIQKYNEKDPLAEQISGNIKSDLNFTQTCLLYAPKSLFAAKVTKLDTYVGDLMNLISKLGISEKTIIVFTSNNRFSQSDENENVQITDNEKFRGSNRDLYEGGIRVPLIVSNSVLIKKGITNQISGFCDFAPTFTELTNIQREEESDGISMLETWKGNQKEQKQHEYLYWEFNKQGGKIAIRKDNWKGVKRNIFSDPLAAIELYDLSKDIHEDNNVASQNPKIVEWMEKIMKKENSTSISHHSN